MPLTMKCACGKTLDVADEQHGQPAQCPWCGNRFTAGAAINSTTAVQAEQPMPKVAEREAARPEMKPDETPMIALSQPWRIPPAIWFLIFGTLGCGVLLYGGSFLLIQVGGDATQEDIAKTQVSGSLTHACQAYRIKRDRFPKNLEELLAKDALGGPYLEGPDALIDPWGRRYQYDPKGPRNNGAKPDIWTVTPQGIEIGNWPRDR